jgi:hypothetical protein
MLGRTRAWLLAAAVIASTIAWLLFRDGETRPGTPAIGTVRSSVPAPPPVVAPPLPSALPAAPPAPEAAAPTPEAAAPAPAAAPSAPAEPDTVSGRVVFPDGAPVAGIEIVFGHGRTVTTDAEGRFTLDELRGEMASLRIPIADVESSVRVGDLDAYVEFAFHVVRLRAVDEWREPIPKAYLETFPVPRWETKRLCNPMRSPDGAIVFAAPSGSSCRYLLRASGFSAETGSIPVEGAPRAHEVIVPMAVETPPGVLTLRVTDALGAPVTNAYITCEDTRGYGRRWDLDDIVRKAPFDPGGRITFAGLPSGRYRFLVEPSHEARGTARFVVPVTVEVEIRPQEISAHDVVFQVGGLLLLKVLDADGLAVTPDTLYLVDDKGRELRRVFHGEADAHVEEGAEPPPPAEYPWYTHTPVLPGEYVVRASIGAPGSPEYRTASAAIRIPPLVAPQFHRTKAELRFPR